MSAAAIEGNNTAPTPGMMNRIAAADGAGIPDREVNVNAPHYIWIALAPIFIGHRNRGASFMGDFPGEVLPAKTPVLITPTRAYATREIQAISIESQDNAFDKTLPDPEAKVSNSQIANNSAYDLVKFIEKEYVDFGVAALWELTDESGEDVNNLFSILFNEKYFEDLAKDGNIREIEGVEFQGPFLDQIRTYLTTEGMKAARRVGITNELREVIQKTHGAIVAAVDRAWSFANAKLNDTEILIRARQNGKPGKEWYDMPDYRYPNAQPPLDLVCLAQTGRSPLDLRELDASREMSATIGASVVDGIKEAMAGGGKAEGTVSIADVKKLLAEQDAKYQKQIDELKKGTPATE